MSDYLCCKSYGGAVMDEVVATTGQLRMRLLGGLIDSDESVDDVMVHCSGKVSVAQEVKL